MATNGSKSKVVSGPVSVWEEIGPDLAIAYLETARDPDYREKGNRRIKQDKLDSYSAQMKAGLWRKTHQGIAFDLHGCLVDGQHRLWSIIETGCNIVLMVTRGLNDDDVDVIDTGMARTYEDIAHYKGWNTDPLTGSLAKILVQGITLKSQVVPAAKVHGWYEHYREGIDFALELRAVSRPRAGKSMTAPMAAAFARARYCVKVELLLRMGEILKSGQYSHDADRAAFVLREAWLDKRIGHGAPEQYFKTEGAIRAFAERRAIKVMQRPEAEIFQIPKLPMALRFTVTQTKESPRAGKRVRSEFKEGARA